MTPANILSETRLRSEATSSLAYGRLHAPDLDGFGYVGLGVTALHAANQQHIAINAIAELQSRFPADAMLVIGPDGPRLLVRAFATPGEVSEAFRVAAAYAVHAGV